MGTAQASQGLEGDKLYQQRARSALPILVRQAHAGQTIYYAALAEELGLSSPRVLNYPLGSIGTSLQELSEVWGEEIPQIQCIVVNQATGLPGVGIGEFISDPRSFAKLNAKQKRAVVDSVLARIYAYDRWDEVLRAFGLRRAPVDDGLSETVRKAATLDRGYGGEGEEHRTLKLFIRDHPDCLGIKGQAEASVEKDLPSGDTIDVFFETGSTWIGVEVKSVLSGEADILRGLYQCVKYRAVLESHLSVLDEERDVRVVLALGGGLPASLIPVRNTLGVEVVDNIVS